MSYGQRLFSSPAFEDIKRDVHEILTVGGDHWYSRWFDLFIMSLIAANVLAVMLATVDSVYSAYQPAFRYFEIISVLIFSVEYVGRLWSCTVNQEYSGLLIGRIRFATRPFLIIDLLAILPFFLGVLFIDTRFLRALRLFRFFRLLKLARYSEAMQSFVYVAQNKKEDLTIAFSATTILLIISSSLMYFVEREAQPEVFSSIPEALWWGIITLTTVGYGDVYPITPFGRVLGALISLLGVGLVALPASILASGFIEEEDETDGVCPHCGEYVDELEDSTSEGR